MFPLRGSGKRVNSPNGCLLPGLRTQSDCTLHHAVYCAVGDMVLLLVVEQDAAVKVAARHEDQPSVRQNFTEGQQQMFNSPVANMAENGRRQATLGKILLRRLDELR